MTAESEVPLAFAMEGKPVNLKTYHAYSMAEALAAVKRDLGASAVILNTRTFRRGGFLGLGRKTIVEVTATNATQPAAASSAAPKRKPQSVQARRAYASGASGAAVAERVAAPAADPGGMLAEDRERTRRLAIAMDEAHRRRSAAGPADQPRVDSNSAPRLAIAAAVTAPLAPVAQRFVLTCPQRLSKQTVSAPSASAAAVAIENKPSSVSVQTIEPTVVPKVMQDELVAIREMVGQVLQRQAASSAGAPASMPKELFDMYLKLIAQDISEELADQIVSAVSDELDAKGLENVEIVRGAVLRQLSNFIPVDEGGAFEALNAARAQSGETGRPLTLALVGPTGVGKTTTLAKLAATFKLRHNRSVGLITADTYRIAAVDQLRTYAEILDLPLQVAITPAEMKRAVAALSDRDVVLIDTAGRSQNDADRISELRRFLAAAQPHQVHLVLSSTAAEKVLLQEAQAFSAVGVDKIVLTKLDEAVSFGMLVNVIRQIGKQLSFVTTGQEVPDDLEVGRAERLAELVLGGSLHD